MYIKKWRYNNYNSPPIDFDELSTEVASYLRLPGNWYNRWSGLFVYLSFVRRVKKLHRENPFDVIYATDFFPDGDAAARLGRKFAIPVVCLGIGVDVNITAYSSPAIEKRFRVLLRDTQGCISCGASVERGIRHCYDGPIINVFGVVDVDKYSPINEAEKSVLRAKLSLQEDRYIFLFAGYLEVRKGIFELVSALSLIVENKQDALLVLCGEGRDRPRLEEFVDSLKLKEYVRFAGSVSPNLMDSWYKVADVFVLPSHTEGMPNALMEALSCGIPSVATKVGGVPDAVAGSDGVSLVEPQNAAKLAQSCIGIMTDKARYNSSRIAARELAMSKFGIFKNAATIYSFLVGVVERAREKQNG